MATRSKSSAKPVGKFIVIESIDAAGGSTQADLLVARLQQAGYQPHKFHYPQHNEPTGQVVYGKFLHAKNTAKFTRREQALLYIQDFFAGSSQLRNAIESAPNAVAVSDRYCTSTMAYQTIGMTGARRQTLLAWMKWMCWQGTPKLPKPDLVLLLDLPTEISVKNLTGRRQDYFENKQKQEAIRRSYLKLANTQRWKVVNCALGQGKSAVQRSREDIHSDVWQAVEAVIS